MLEITRIDAENPNAEEMRRALNLLSLVAQCHELEIVDRGALKKMFRKCYLDVYSDIAGINRRVEIGATNKPGKDFLGDVPYLKTLYDDWSRD